MADSATRSNFSTKLLIVVFVLVLLIAGGLFVGDRVARSQAQERVATSLQQTFGTAEKPQVTMGGVPFLTQLMGNRYQQIDLVADGISTTEVPIKHLTAKLTDVDAAKDMSTVVAKNASGQATVAWDEVSKKANNLPIQFVEPDRVKVDYTAAVMGIKVQAVVTAKPSVDAANSTVVLSEPQMTIASVNIPADMTKGLLDTLVKPLPIPLPSTLKATGGKATADGMVIDFAGENVDLAKLK